MATGRDHSGACRDARLPFAKLARTLAVAVGALALTASGAAAGPLTSASLTIKLGTLPAATFPGVGVTGSATSALSASIGAGTGFAGTVATLIPTTAAPPLTGLTYVVTKNDAGTFTGTVPSKIGGAAAVYGSIFVEIAGGPLLLVPLQLGAPNTIFHAPGGGLSVTAISAAWTAGTAALPPIGTATTFTATAMGSNALTPGGQGTLVLVTPLRVITNLAGVIPAFGTLTLTYVPEPGTFALVALGIAALAAAVRRTR
jgi:hypothetical protein